MNNISLSSNTHIRLEKADLISASKSFYHVDRIAPFHVLIYCIEGCINVCEDDIYYSIMPGECLILKCGHHQKPSTLIKSGSSWIYVHFYTQEISLCPDSNSECFEINLPTYVKNLKNTKTEDLLYNFIESIHSNSIVEMLHANSSLFKILLSLYEDSREYQETKLYEDIHYYLSTHLEKHITTKELEEHFHLSYKYMEHIYKKKYGISIIQEHISLRIKKSAQSLRSTNLSVLEISKMYGFSDQLYFSRCFKKHTGLSPQKYRTSQMKI